MKKCKNISISVICSFFLMLNFLLAKVNDYQNDTTDYFACEVSNDDWYYGGHLHIPVSGDLTDDKEFIDEAVFAANIQLDLEKSEALYNAIPESLGGKILDTDIARNLYEPYAKDIDGRHQYVCSTLMPAALFVDYLYFKHIYKWVPLNKTTDVCLPRANVLLLAGGDGSGKSTSVGRLDLSILEEAVLIKDSTMTSNFEYHRDMIEKTLDLGFNVTIVYVFRPIELALESNIKRAKIIGRVRPLVEIAEAHYKAQQNVLQLSQYFGERIDILVIDNSGNFEEVSVVTEPIDFLKSPEVGYNSQEEVLNRTLLAYRNIDKSDIPTFITDLLERKLDSCLIEEEYQKVKFENERWISYLQKIISTTIESMGF